MPKKILILYTSVGLGHKTIAENIGYHLEQAGYEVKLSDVLQLQAGKLVDFGKVLHKGINSFAPWVWEWLYKHAHQSWFAELTLPNRVRVAGRNYHHVKATIDNFQPDLVITTETSASAIIQFLKQKGWYKNLFAITFSDYHLHRYWLYDAADFYLSNIEEQKQEMIQLGIPSEKIYVIGMTLRPKPTIDVAAVRQKLNINPEEKVVLLASGSLGIGLATQWIIKLSQLINQQLKAKVIIVCGKNQKLHGQLQAKLKDQALVFGYYQPLAELYAISDIFLTKPGGLSVAEALQWHLPMLITHCLPGQEEINVNYLKSKGLIMPQPGSVEPDKLLPVIAQELRGHAFQQSLISNAFLVDLIQQGQEGHALQAAVRQEFHEV